MSLDVKKESGAWVLRAEQTLPAPLDAVFPFFADAHNLEAITPDFLRFEVLSPRDEPMAAGRLIDYRLKVRGIPLRWRSRIDVWEPPYRFVDVQVKGPYRLWHHTHEFEPVTAGGRGTLVRDIVRYRPIGGALVNALFVQRDVVRIFEHRQRMLAQRFAQR